MSDDFYKGFEELSNLLEEYIEKVENPQDILVVGAKKYVSDLSKLPRPYSQLKRVNSKHMLDTMHYRRAKNNEVEVGAGVYWLNFVERGTGRTTKRKWGTPANPFMRRTWGANSNKYYEAMLKEAGF